MTTRSRRVKVIVNGKPYLVEVGDLSNSPITVIVNGQPYSVKIETDGVVAVPAEEAVPVKAPPPAPAAGQLVSEVRAPMPGTILDITVKPGDHVQFRQQLCSLEAMKMKSAICSPRDGIIAGVAVTEGQVVAYDDVLFTFE